MIRSLLPVFLYTFVRCNVVQVVSPLSCDIADATVSLRLVVRDMRVGDDNNTILFSVQTSSSTWNYDIPVRRVCELS
jgi:hypothetical protein